jgi:hypothetical protein
VTFLLQYSFCARQLLYRKYGFDSDISTNSPHHTKICEIIGKQDIRFLIEEKNDGSLYYTTCFCDQVLAMLFTFEIKTIDQEVQDAIIG